MHPKTNDIQLLDCTLRDGGYVNDWKFGQKNLVSIFERLVDSHVDIIEVGFLDQRRPFDIDRSIMPDTSCVDKIWGKIDKKGTMVVGMIDFGTCDIKNLQKCSNSYLDGIRVIFKKHLMREALEYVRKVKELGYKVFAQMVSITSYNRDELLEFSKLVNEVKPYGISLVDTYGLLHPEDIADFYDVLNENVDPEIVIGFHAHNNFQLGYANALRFIENRGNRKVIIDGTLYGMGKSAGNPPLELIAMRLNERFGKQYRIESLLESIKESLMDIYWEYPWGYKTFFYMCSVNKCHPNYVTFFEQTQNVSASKIFSLLSKIQPTDKKLLYDKSVAEKIYSDYLNGEGNDSNARSNLKKELKGRSVMVVGPGKNSILQKDVINKFIKSQKPYIISINYIPESIDVDCVFVTNGKRYHDMTLSLKESKNKNVKIIATSNVECVNGTFDFVVNRAPLLEKSEKIIDNSFLMLVKLLQSLGVDGVYCVGLDGYSEKEDNYCNPSMEYDFVKKEAYWLNYHMKEKIAEFRQSMKIQFITYSAYDTVEDINGAFI